MKKNSRPLSPHLTIYKPQITSIMSILHRITGVFQSFGTLLVFISFILLFLGEKYYEIVNLFFNTYLGRAFLFFYILSLSYHLCNGIRHLIWDIGLGFEIKNVHYTGYLTIISAFLLNLIVWVF